MLKVVVFSLAIVAINCQLDDRTVAEYVKQEGLNTLALYLTSSGLDATLNDPNAPAVTLFAPTEDAFAKLPPDVLVSLTTNSTALKTVLTGHVVDEIVLSLYLRDKTVKQNLNGNPLNFRVYPNGVKTINGAKLIGQDVSLRNGVVHRIESVLLPLDTNIGEYVAQHDTDFKDLFSLLVLGRLYGTLATAGPFTVFAPVDSAFEAIQANFTALLQDRNAVTDLLKHHVVADTYWSAGLTDGMVLTALDGKTLTVSINSNGVMIDGAKVTTADVGCSNGVIHVIDAVLEP